MSHDMIIVYDHLLNTVKVFRDAPASVDVISFALNTGDYVIFMFTFYPRRNVGQPWAESYFSENISVILASFDLNVS